MLKNEEIKLFKEKKYLEDNYKNNLKELRKLSTFFKNNSKFHEEMVKMIENSQKETPSPKEKIDNNDNSNSFLLSNINNINDSFNTMVKNSQKLITSMGNDLIKPFDDFIQNQLNSYNDNLNKIKTINTDYQSLELILDNCKYNYYKSSYLSHINDSNEIGKSIINRNNDFNSKRDNIIKSKMIARNDEFIYKYQNAKFNKKILVINEEYDSLIKDAINIEKSKLLYVQSALDKYKKYLTDYVEIINSFINKIEKLNSKEIVEKELSNIPQIYNKFKIDNNNLRIPKKEYVSYQNYCEKNKDKSDKELSVLKRVVINPTLETSDNECNNLVKNFINKLIEENDVGQENVADIIELLNFSTYEVGKKILNCIFEKVGMSSLVFLNLQNLEYLSNILGYISLHQSSIFNGQFDLNFKIIFIAERVFYKKKTTNDKIYLNALLSKNKYYRTKQFWRNILELKLANKLVEYIKRFKNLVKEKSKGGIFSKLFSNNSAKQSFLDKTRIFPLIKEYNLLDLEQIKLIDKMAIQEMQSIIRENIPIFANFNFPSEECLDLIAELTEEYKIEKEYIKLYVTYFNVSSCTIRKLIPNEKGNTNNIYNQFKALTGINKKLKLFGSIVPFLSYKDYNNLLLCSKIFHKKLSKTIYRYALKQKNLSMKIRLSIWQNLLKISPLKKKYNYREVLSKANEEKVKYEIELDVVRTTVGDVENPQKTREQITNILYAVSQLNGNIKYCQGMNFVVQFLYEIFGEEEAFYIFLAFFINGEYYLAFDKNLHELKILFYVFKRVISLLEPELSSYFISNGVDVNFFVSPWFITLFTSSHQNFKGEKDNSQILIRILDNFILSGFKSIMEVGCVALHSYENVIMNKNYGDMMQFLINEMLRSDFFSKKNQNFIENFFTETKISKKLVKNIEEEYAQEEKLNQKINK